MLKKNSSKQSNHPRHLLFISASAAVTRGTETQNTISKHHLKNRDRGRKVQYKTFPLGTLQTAIPNASITSFASQCRVFPPIHLFPIQKNIMRVSTSATHDDEPYFLRSCRHRNPPLTYFERDNRQCGYVKQEHSARKNIYK